ncbi:MAG: hypothetical protein ABSE76_00710 [Minisyncoccia bacterium]|jgi:hypothetical protein
MEPLRGKLPTRQELSGWDEAKYLAFLQFCQLFITQTPTGSVIRVTKERWQETHSLPLESHQEFFYRIDCSPEDPAATERAFYHRLANMMKGVLGYLRLHPETITPAMREIIEPNQRFKWCLATRTPVPVIIPRPVSFDDKLAEAADKVTDLFIRLVDSISQEDLDQMSPKERVLAASRMQYVFDLKKHLRTYPGSFRHINTQTASIRELEAEVLSYSTRR